MQPILSVRGVSKTYASGHQALGSVDLDINKGEIFALLGPNGAGKTTLISIVCGIVTPSSGTIIVDEHDAISEPRAARMKIGLVPQELSVDMFETVQATTRYSRRLFGRPANDDYIDQVLKDLSLYDKRNSKVMELSGGMKRRVLIAKALAHEPDILFLDEPTAGVDVSLRRDMWKLIGSLRERGTTIILTTHYIEEAEEMADRVGVIDKGRLLLVDDKAAIMGRLGRTEARFRLSVPLAVVPDSLCAYPLHLEDEGLTLAYRGGDGAGKGKAEVAAIAQALPQQGIAYTALDQKESTLEDIFVGLVERVEDAA